jgi:hypothetical protein
MIKLTVSKISDKLLRFDDHDVDDEFFGIAVWLNDVGNPQHSGLVLCYEGEKLFFHFTSKDVLIENVTEIPTEIYYKKLGLFPDSYLPYIRSHFDLLLETVHPLYGFMFTDSYYDKLGHYISDIQDLPDFCTCVGFCINVIRSLFLNPASKYIEIKDWTSESLEKVADHYIEYVNEYLLLVQKLSPESFLEVQKNTYKRIMPVEMLLSGFFSEPKDLPIRKVNIDPHILNTRKILKEKWVSTPD